MKSVSKIMRLFVFMLFAVMLFGMTVFADDVKVQINGNSKDEFKRVIEEINTKLDGTTGSDTVYLTTADKGNKGTKEIYSFDGTTFTFHESNVSKFKEKDVRKALKLMVDGLKDSSIPDSAQNDIMNTIQDSSGDVAALMLPLIFDGTKADMFTAYKWLYPFLQVVRVIFGLGATVIIFMAVGTTIMDLAYIGLPVWREAQAESGKNGKAGKERKPFGVTYDAITTVKEVEMNLEVYKNAYLSYLKRRAVTYIVLSLAVLYLVAGELSGLISWILQLGSGIVQ